MDQALYLTFRVNLRNLVKNKLGIAKEWHISLQDIDRLPYFEYEWMLEEIDIIAKEQEKRNKEEEKKYNSINKSMPNMNTLTNNMQRSLPKVSLPKFN